MHHDDHVVLLRQLSIFLENRPGALAEVTRKLAHHHVNLRALMIADTEKFGILRIIPDDVEAAVKTLEGLGITHKVTEVVGVEVPDRAGALAEILEVFEGTGVSVDYMYAELDRKGRALLIMKLDPAHRALELLSDAGLY